MLILDLGIWAQVSLFFHVYPLQFHYTRNQINSNHAVIIHGPAFQREVAISPLPLGFTP